MDIRLILDVENPKKIALQKTSNQGVKEKG
jgi:hypothetical protein